MIEPLSGSMIHGAVIEFEKRQPFFTMEIKYMLYYKSISNLSHAVTLSSKLQTIC